MIQITFENASSLWFLLTLPALIFAHFYFLRHAKRKALLFANFKTLKRITGKNLITKNYTLLIFRLFALLFLILALSGVTLWYEGNSNKNDFVFAIDTSASMSSRDVQPTRLEAAKDDAKEFIDALGSNTKIGVVSFAGVALIDTPPIDDKSKVKHIIENISLLKSGGTDIPSAIITSTNLLLDKKRGRSIILITDGSNTIETFLDNSLQRAIDYANEYHVHINTLGIGTSKGPVGYLPKYYNVSAIYNEKNLIKIANSTGGVYDHADNSEELKKALELIVKQRSKQLLRKDLRSQFMLLALLFLFSEWVLINTRFRGLP